MDWLARSMPGHWNGEWYHWNGCAYGKMSADAVKKRIISFLHRNRSTPVNRSTVNAILEMIRLELLVESPTVPCWLADNRKHPANQMVR